MRVRKPLSSADKRGLPIPETILVLYIYLVNTHYTAF